MNIISFSIYNLYCNIYNISPLLKYTMSKIVIFLKFFSRKYVATRIRIFLRKVSYQFQIRLQHSIDCFLRNDDSATFKANSSACTNPEEYWIFHLCMVHQLNHFVKQNSNRWYAHSMLNTKIYSLHSPCQCQCQDIFLSKHFQTLLNIVIV